MPPTLAHGKICYLEIPAVDVARSAQFYERVFGWKSRTRGDGQLAFDDATGQVSGAWVTGRAPMREAGLLLYVMVDSVATTLAAIAAHGGETVKPVCEGAREVIATFHDPAGNLLGLYEEPKSAPGE